jgi:UDP-N-acetylmuramyl pentapeptide phosphotransferase/UDP-N-acetylglucosamine-1-phosphate transferase
MTGFAGLSVPQIAAFLLAAFAVSALFTWAAIGYARHRNLVDLPGHRRSHTTPTPRGGGIGIVLAIVICLAAIGLGIDGATIPTRLIVSIALVASVGWIDDHRPLPILIRLAAQIVSSAVFFWPIIAQTWQEIGAVDRTVIFEDGALIAVFIGLCVWSINLHNFMDGIDGILSTQAIFVFAVLAWLCSLDDRTAHGLQIAVCAAAVVGFLPFNFPRAHIFMGDVGSYVLGLLIFVACVWQFSSSRSMAASGLIAVSAFLTDATCTLLSRLFTGQRWYHPHREHLYQWMTRAGLSHRRVVAWYAAWNLFMVLPVIFFLNRGPIGPDASRGWGAAVGFYVVAIVVWFAARRWCFSRMEKQLNRADA